MREHLCGKRGGGRVSRLRLLKEEKEITRGSDDRERRRKELPGVRVDKAYRFETDDGSALLADLGKWRSQLLACHVMFEPDFKAGCPTCSMIAGGFNCFAGHLSQHVVLLAP